LEIRNNRLSEIHQACFVWIAAPFGDLTTFACEELSRDTGALRGFSANFSVNRRSRLASLVPPLQSYNTTYVPCTYWHGHRLAQDYRNNY